MWLAKDNFSPFELSTSVWLAKDKLSPFELSTSVWLAKDNLSPFELSTSVWLAKDNLSPFELSTSVWLVNHNFSPQYYAAIKLGYMRSNGLQYMYADWVCYHLPPLNTASCHIHRNLFHTPHALSHCLHTFSCRLFRESSQVCVPGLEIITGVKNLSCVYTTARVMETALVLKHVYNLQKFKSDFIRTLQNYENLLWWQLTNCPRTCFFETGSFLRTLD